MTAASGSRAGLAVAIMLVTPLLFSTNLVVGRMVVEEVAPFTLAFVRWTCVAIALLPFALRLREDARGAAAANWRLILLLGFLGMVVCGGGVYLGLQHTTATNGALIYATSPVIIILIEALSFGRRIAVREAVGSALAFAGVAVIVLRGDPGTLAALDFNPGDLLIFAAAICWAAYGVLYRSPGLSGVPGMGLFALIAIAGAALNLPVALWEFTSGGGLPMTPRAWSGLAGIVLFASLLAYSGFQFGARTLGPSLTGIFMYLMPVYGAALAVMLLGETIMPYHLAGIALVLSGISLATFPASLLRRSA